MSRRSRAFPLTAVALWILAAACSGAGDSVDSAASVAPGDSSTSFVSETSASRLRLGMVVHAESPLGGGFWTVVSLGALEAAEGNGVDLEIHGDFDPDVQARIVETLIADGIDGLIVSLAAPEALKPALDRAAAAGIPVITINSGIEHYLETNALTHVGQDEFTAGRSVGDRLTAMGLTGDVLCVIQESGNVGLEARCDGVEAAYSGGEIVRIREDLEVTGQDEAVSLISSELESGDFAAVIALDLDTGLAAADAVIAARADAVVATFDLAPWAFDRIRSGEIAFAIDQQGYLQGSTPVELLVDYLRDGTMPDRDQPVETGTFVVDAANIDEVAQEAALIDARIEARFFS